MPRRVNPRPIPQVDAPELPPLGVLIADDDGERVQCHICGSFYRNLGIHVRRKHRLDPDLYRAEYQLNRTASLAAPELKVRLADIHRAHLDVIRPDQSPIEAAPRQQGATGGSRRKRLQAQIAHAEDVRRWWSRQPRVLKPRPMVTPIGERIRRANAKRSTLLRDPEWRQRWIDRIREGRRRRR